MPGPSINSELTSSPAYRTTLGETCWWCDTVWVRQFATPDNTEATLGAGSSRKQGEPEAMGERPTETRDLSSYPRPPARLGIALSVTPPISVRAGSR